MSTPSRLTFDLTRIGLSLSNIGAIFFKIQSGTKCSWGLGDTGNEFPFGPDSLQVHDCTRHVRGNGAFIPQVKSQL